VVADIYGAMYSLFHIYVDEVSVAQTSSSSSRASATSIVSPYSIPPPGRSYIHVYGQRDFFIIRTLSSWIYIP